MNRKWTLGIGLLAVVALFLILWHFTPAIQRWLADVFLEILLLAATFSAGWLVGRFGSKRRPNREERNVRNITEAQK